MSSLKKINEAANNWEKTKNLKYKDLWYKRIKEFVYGKDINNNDSVIQRRSSSRKIRSK